MHVHYQSHASDTVVTVNHEKDPCTVRQAQQPELGQRQNPRHEARSSHCTVLILKLQSGYLTNVKYLIIQIGHDTACNNSE
jgi:hypothetical protein